MKKITCFLLLTAVLLSCQKGTKPAVAFYYWKTVYKLTAVEKQVLKDNHAAKLYIRYFDLALDKATKQPRPLSAVHFLEKPDVTVVPVIYIKNEVMLQREIDLVALAKKMTGFVNQINAKTGISVKEIQIDCDWTLSSRDNYLKFVDLFQKSSGCALSATIRLHQIKYFEKTKIPNVKNGVLMYYNMGNIAPDSLNSIYSSDIAKRYLKSLKSYPLRLNVALPVYSWAVHIRDHKVIGLKSKTEIVGLQNNPDFINTNPRFFYVKNSHYSKGTFYRKGDVLKMEQISSEDLTEMARELQVHLKNPPAEIIFYDLDELNTKTYEKGFFEAVADRF